MPRCWASPIRPWPACSGDGVTTGILLGLLALGAGAGFMAGLFGVGGGMVMVPFLTMVFAARGVSADLIVQMSLATALATIMFTSLSSLRAHHKAGAVRWPVVWMLVPGILLGGQLGARIVAYLPGRLLAGMFAVFVMAELYQVRPQSITQHIKAIYQELEIDETATCKEYLQVQTEGGREVKRQLKHYSLPMIIAVGYRVRSSRGTQFRQWATRTLGEYLQKGFVLDDERLKNPPVGTIPAPDHFDELLERIRDIRASEKRVYLRVREILKLI